MVTLLVLQIVKPNYQLKAGDTMRPLIGITCDYSIDNNNITLKSDYYWSIYKAGGQPVLIPYIDFDGTYHLVSVLDGIVFTGGNDIDPVYYGEAPHPKLGQINPVRDEFELKLCRLALEKDKPVLGICRGAQVMNVSLGGTLYQDLEAQLQSDTLIKHRQSAPEWHVTHEVKLEAGSRLNRILGQECIWVNSFHHQAVKEVAATLRATGWSSDGAIEVIESDKYTFALGVQWHPERMFVRDQAMQLLFKAFVEACGTGRQGV